jgi:hypothetical protein
VFIPPQDAQRPRLGDAARRLPAVRLRLRARAGYFLIAIWGIHYFTVTGLGLAAGLLIDMLVPDAPVAAGLVTAVPTVLFGFFFARYAKALYLAIDHYFDPHV